MGLFTNLLIVALHGAFSCWGSQYESVLRAKWKSVWVWLEACQWLLTNSAYLCGIVLAGVFMFVLRARFIDLLSQPVPCSNAPFVNLKHLWATCLSELDFLSVVDLILFLLPIASCFLTDQKLHKSLGDSGSVAFWQPFNYGSHQAGNARLMDVSGPALWHGDVRLP